VVTRRSRIADTLRQRLFSAVHLGLLQPGERLPSARELAREFNTDRRVILRAYQELEREGLVELRPRSGIYFTTLRGPAGGDLSRQAKWLADVLVQALLRGIPAPEFPDQLHAYLGTLRLRAACLECNDDQIESLCAELRADYGFETSGVDVDALIAEEKSLPEVRRADLLVTTPFHAGEVKELAERQGKPWIAASLKADIFAEIARRLPAGPVYFVVTDPRFAEKLGKIFANTAGAANLRALIEGRDDLDQIGADSPVYVTTLARERLAGTPLLRRVIPEMRVFSPESARELLTFVLRANMQALAGREVSRSIV